MDPNYVKKFFATQVKHGVDETIKEFLDDLKGNMNLQEIEEKWEKRLHQKV
jgi:hypothetical protein